MSGRAPVVRTFGLRLRRSHRLVPSWARRLRSRQIVLSAGGRMRWHSTQEREELLLCLAGGAVLEWRPPDGRAARRVRLRSGEGAFVASGILHRILNVGPGPVRYVYVTG